LFQAIEIKTFVPGFGVYVIRQCYKLLFQERSKRRCPLRSASRLFSGTLNRAVAVWPL